LLNSSLKTRALRESTTPSEAGLDLGRLYLILVENATMEGDIRSKTIELKRVPLTRLPSHKKLARSIVQYTWPLEDNWLLAGDGSFEKDMSS
jgi:hypothetical protein